MMKSYRLSITILLLSFTLLMSCSKDDSNPTEPDNGENNGNSNNSGQVGFNYWFSKSMAVQVRAGYYPYISAAILFNL